MFSSTGCRPDAPNTRELESVMLKHGTGDNAQRLADEIASRLAGLSSRTTPAARSVRREYSRLLAKAAPGLVVRIALLLARRTGFACRFVAYEIVQQHRAALAGLTPDQLLKLGQ